MKNTLLILLAAVFLYSCYATHDDGTLIPPEDLIGTEKMSLILADVEIAESALRQKQNFGHEIGKVQEEYYYAIFTEHEVSKDQFERSLSYYKQDREAMNQIYEDVITRLSVIESEVQLEKRESEE